MNFFQCIFPTWFISVNMQLYLISPPIIFAVAKFGWRCAALLGLIAFATIAYIFTMSLIYDFSFSNMSTLWERLIIFPTHTRLAQWFLGLFLGYILFAIKNRGNEQKTQRWKVPESWEPWLWTFSIVTVVAVIFLPLPAHMVDSENVLIFAFYDALHRLAWCTAIAWIIYGCVVGHGGVLDKFLSIPILQPFTRLSYCVFILHFPVVVVTKSLQRTPEYFSEYMAFHFFMGVLATSVLVSVPWYLFFEAPVINLEKEIREKN